MWRPEGQGSILAYNFPARPTVPHRRPFDIGDFLQTPRVIFLAEDFGHSATLRRLVDQYLYIL